MSEPAPAFIPLESYKPPPMPAEEYLRRLVGWVQALIARNDSKPFIADDKLKRASLNMLDDVVAPPACGPLIAELDRSVRDWLAERPQGSTVKAVVVPPCEETGIMDAWAEQFGHPIVPPPSRDALIDHPAPALPSLAGDGLLVVPRLEEWFMRHRNGLRTVRALLAALDACNRPIVVGCNSWAWTYLAKSVAADQLLPGPITFRAFDERRLHGWFAELAESDSTARIQFRRSATGRDVMELDSDGTPKDDFLRTLAGRSLGIPWVAWNMWRRSLRSEESASDDAASLASADEAEQPGEQTLWVAALDEMILPGMHEQAALLVMQALLIHGPLSAAQLRLVLPIVGESNIVPVLVKSGFLRRTGDLFGCRPAAYPIIRDGLEKAGLPLDAI